MAKALALEQQLTGVILPIAGAEIERPDRPWEAYEVRLEHMGLSAAGPARSL